MNFDKEFLIYIEEKQNFSGWDFSFITETGRMQNQLLSWSYGSLVIPFIHQAKSMLDMGTGGGEFLSKLSPLPPTVFATEGYKPNVPIAKSRLEPLGVKVIQVEDDEELPLKDHQFDLILNRHESFFPKELKRIIKEEGIFITQQVGGMDCAQINELLEAPPHEYRSWSIDDAMQGLKDNQFKIIYSKEEFPILRFYDIGALLYYLKAIPWQVPGFSTELYLEKLYQIHQKIKENGYLDVKQHRFIIKAQAI
jgi:SAM-dependent methyltransferase